MHNVLAPTTTKFNCQLICMLHICLGKTSFYFSVSLIKMVVSSGSVVQYGRRKGSSRKNSEHVRDDTTVPIQAPDLRQIAVLPKADWLRIQDNLNHVNKEKENFKEASKQREMLHQRSQEVVKLWPNTIAVNRQKKLEAKKLREEMQEKEREQTDLEEAKYQQEKRKEAIEKCRTQQYFQTDRVKGLHCALLLSEVMKEREAQLALKQRQLDRHRDVERDIAAQLRSQEEKALKKEQHNAEQRRLENKLVAQQLQQQIKEHELLKEQEMLETKRETEEVQQLQEIYKMESRREEQRRREEKRDIMKTHMEHLAIQDAIRAMEKQKEAMEDEHRRLFASAKDKMMKMRNEKEAEMFREVQRYKQAILEKLAATKQEEVMDEEERIAKAVAQKEAKLAKEQKEKDEQKAAMLNAITSHRDAMRQEKEAKEREEKSMAQELLFAKKEANRAFLEEQQLKLQKIKDDCKAVQDIHIHQMAERRAKEHLLWKEQMEFDTKNAELLTMEERQFQTYVQGIIDAAAEAKRNIYPLQKAARQAVTGGLGPVFVELHHLVHNETGAQMPGYLANTAHDIKELPKTAAFQQSKKRLGFTC